MNRKRENLYKAGCLRIVCIVSFFPSPIIPLPSDRRRRRRNRSRRCRSVPAGPHIVVFLNVIQTLSLLLPPFSLVPPGKAVGGQFLRAKLVDVPVGSHIHLSIVFDVNSSPGSAYTAPKDGAS
ncbi:hypothetical protein FA13DRAFT_335435 [Coprinellus micaceus]|uniref:Uncharacterized protein n=1 Tax=Coprinellus micaceus TaxID=71717 RepID=A0A4Y7TBR8_COPMI|nr:hypothetical protein FA13DRAFT_335435 [Coprinellus micaceus]